MNFKMNLFALFTHANPFHPALHIAINWCYEITIITKGIEVHVTTWQRTRTPIRRNGTSPALGIRKIIKEQGYLKGNEAAWVHLGTRCSRTDDKSRSAMSACVCLKHILRTGQERCAFIWVLRLSEIGRFPLSLTKHSLLSGTYNLII